MELLLHTNLNAQIIEKYNEKEPFENKIQDGKKYESINLSCSPLL